MGLFKIKDLFQQTKQVRRFKQRICAEMEQISRDIIERSVQGVGEGQIVGGGHFQHLRYILLLTLDLCLLLFKVN
jgi:hypothetical protein